MSGFSSDINVRGGGVHTLQADVRLVEDQESGGIRRIVRRKPAKLGGRLPGGSRAAGGGRRRNARRHAQGPTGCAGKPWSRRSGAPFSGPHAGVPREDQQDSRRGAVWTAARDAGSASTRCGPSMAAIKARSCSGWPARPRRAGRVRLDPLLSPRFFQLRPPLGGPIGLAGSGRDRVPTFVKAYDPFQRLAKPLGAILLGNAFGVPGQPLG